ncbi:MAG: hypothetical protein Q8Q25_03140, partial [bacterium]|nr:hypothetical protein [bacterium]
MTVADMKQNLIVFWYFVRRDWYVNTKQLRDMILNYCLLYPAQYAITFAYLQARSYFGTHNIKQATVFFAGSILVIILVLSFQITKNLFLDLQNNRFIDYQITVLHPRLIILEQILFSSFFTFIFSIPFYPVAKLLLRHNLDTTNTSWLHLMVILYAGSLCLSAYHQCATLILKRIDQLNSLWARANFALFTFGGFWIPLHTMYSYSPLFARIMLFN